jgi:hypothetical protein
VAGRGDSYRRPGLSAGLGLVGFQESVLNQELSAFD